MRAEPTRFPSSLRSRDLPVVVVACVWLTLSVAPASALALSYSEPAGGFRAPTSVEAERAQAAPVRTPSVGAGRAPVRGRGGRGRVATLTASLRVVSVRALRAGGTIRTRARFIRLGGAPLRRHFSLTLEGGRIGRTTLNSTAYPVLRRGLRLRVRFVLDGGRWTFVGAERIGRAHGAGRRPLARSSGWTGFGPPFAPERIPVYWRAQPGLPGWASGAINWGWAIWTADPRSFFQDARTGDGGAARIGGCGKGSFVTFHDLPPGVAGWATYCTDGQGRRSEAQIELDYQVNYDLASAAAHEVGHAAVALGHSDDRRDIMWPVVTGYRALGPGDLQGLRTHYPGRAVFTLDAQSGIDQNGTTVAYPDRRTLAFNLRVRGGVCDPASMWMRLERPELGRFLFEGYDPASARVALSRAPNDPAVCYARVNVGARTQNDTSPGLIRFSWRAPTAASVWSSRARSSTFRRPGSPPSSSPRPQSRWCAPAASARSSCGSETVRGSRGSAASTTSTAPTSRAATSPTPTAARTHTPPSGSTATRS